MKYEQPYGTGTSHIAVEGSIYNSIDAFMYYLLFNAARPHARDCMPQQTCLTKLMSPCLYCCCSRLSMTWQCPSVFAQNKNLWWHNNESYENQKNKKISELVVLTSSYFSLLYITFHDECSKHSWNTTFERCNSRMHEIADNLDITKNTPADILVPFNNRLSYSCFCSGC